ncbi:hypothetical protein BUALT_Bualt01G0111100 [Buddleja alternifolia]|uniref:Uncharacterized protein n=1 Tax=Buddleja alternifolia TaxID=168488 RepID=A0AAV6Y8J5_9LAMI|nr:hypothetical protein BUALT_Bualt01G0111100 [Buddleja alternifolia]
MKVEAQFLNKLSVFKKYEVSKILYVDSRWGFNFGKKDPLLELVFLETGGIYTKAHLQHQMDILDMFGMSQKLFEGRAFNVNVGKQALKVLDLLSLFFNVDIRYRSDPWDALRNFSSARGQSGPKFPVEVSGELRFPGSSSSYGIGIQLFGSATADFVINHDLGVGALLLNKLSTFKKYEVSEILFIDSHWGFNFGKEDPLLELVFLEMGGIYTKAQLQHQLDVLDTTHRGKPCLLPSLELDEINEMLRANGKVTSRLLQNITRKLLKCFMHLDNAVINGMPYQNFHWHEVKVNQTFQLKHVEEGNGKPPPFVLVLNGHYGGYFGAVTTYDAFILEGPRSMRRYGVGELAASRNILQLNKLNVFKKYEVSEILFIDSHWGFNFGKEDHLLELVFLETGDPKTAEKATIDYYRRQWKSFCNKTHRGKPCLLPSLELDEINDMLRTNENVTSRLLQNIKRKLLK